MKGLQNHRRSGRTKDTWWKLSWSQDGKNTWETQKPFQFVKRFTIGSS
jgi:hypothetical protein